MKSLACIGRLETVPLPSDAFAEAGFMPELHAHQRRHVETRKHVRSETHVHGICKTFAIAAGNSGFGVHCQRFSGTEEDVIVIPVVGVKYVAWYYLL